MALTHPNNPAPPTEGRCNALLWNCKGEIDGEPCDYRYPDAEGTVCPFCGTPRQRCKSWPIKGREACMFHGGKALMGIDHPTYKGSGLSKHLPTRLLDTFFEAMENPDILNGTEDIATLQARIRELLARQRDNLPPAEIWGQLGNLFKKYRQQEHTAATGQTAGQRKNAMQKMMDTLNEIEAIIIKGYFERETWQEITGLTEQIRKLRETERRRLKDAEQMITPAQFNTLLVQFIQTVKLNVRNPEDRRTVLNTLQAMRVTR